jgi:hypothetical protein
MREVPVIVRSDLTPAQVKAARIADNKLAESEWDIDSLKNEMFLLKGMDFNLDFLGFSNIEIMSIDPNILGDGALRALNAEDAKREWDDAMPDFEDSAPCYRKIIVNFDTPEDVEDFFKLIGQSCTEKTKSIWHPKKERRDLEAKRWE